jgi:hypothetical protein
MTKRFSALHAPEVITVFALEMLTGKRVGHFWRL